jgi:hydrogenase maturation protein HypF
MERLADWSGDGREGAGLFHAVTCGALAAWILQAAQRAGVCAVALSGGCMMNALLREGLSARLEAAGVRVLKPLAVPAGDGGISLGQAWVALTTTGV